MNPAAVHLALNIFPPVLNFAAIVVLLIAMFAKSAAVVRAALVLLLLASAFAVPVYLSGEEAEHLVEKLEGVDAQAIHPHEDAAEWAYRVFLLQGVLVIAALIAFRKGDVPAWAVWATLLLALFASTVVFRTAYLGGKIRHPETQMVTRSTDAEFAG
jgi:hypothetical protein